MFSDDEESQGLSGSDDDSVESDKPVTKKVKPAPKDDSVQYEQDEDENQIESKIVDRSLA